MTGYARQNWQRWLSLETLDAVDSSTCVACSDLPGPCDHGLKTSTDLRHITSKDVQLRRSKDRSRLAVRLVGQCTCT